MINLRHWLVLTHARWLIPKSNKLITPRIADIEKIEISNIITGERILKKEVISSKVLYFSLLGKTWLGINSDPIVIDKDIETIYQSPRL